MTTFADFAPTYLSIKEMEGVRALARVRFALAHLTGAMGGVPLSEVTPGIVHLYRRARLDAGMANATVNREVAVLSNFFTIAIEERVTDRNPTARIRPLPVLGHRDRQITPDEYARLMQVSAQPLRDMICLGYETAMRAGEILSLEWDRVNLDDEYVFLPAELTKTREERMVPLSAPAVACLEALRGSCATGPVILCGGRPYRHYGNAWTRACARAQVEGANFHDLRHSCVTRWRRAGVHHSVIMRITGHKSSAMFLTYNSVDMAEMRAAVCGPS